MNAQSQAVQSKGIYHGLPVHPSSASGLTAIITGANGISGQHMLRVLSESPKVWSKIYCLSRRPPALADHMPPQAEHIPCDFLQTPEQLAAILKEKSVHADHIFFFAYIQPPPLEEGKSVWSDAKELVRLNKLILDNFLGALKLADITPKRFMLQTGAKNYGVHLGPSKVPQEESDPRVLIEPNFYYEQEDSLYRYCEETGVGLGIAMPCWILGAVPDNAMNLAFPLAVYAAVCRHLGEPLEFPADMRGWTNVYSMSSAMMNSYLEEWMVLSDRARNEKFNACDQSAFAWESLWPRIAGWYGIEWKGPHLDPSRYTEVKTAHDPPPRGYGDVATIRARFSMVDWANQPKVARAWEELANEHGLVERKLVDVHRVFSILDMVVSASSPVLFSMDKARKRGFHGFVDTSESFLEVFDGFAKLKMIPPVPKTRVSFN